MVGFGLLILWFVISLSDEKKSLLWYLLLILGITSIIIGL